MSAVIQNEYTGNNSTTTYSFTFPYLKTSDIKASLDGVATTAFTLPNATTLQFNTAPGSGVSIKIFRETSVDDLTATFYAGSAIKSEDLNDNFTQNLYKTQEVGARSLNTLGGTMTGDLTLGTQADIVFEGATADAHETTIKVVDPTADRTITFPNVTGTVVTTGDTGTVATGMIAGDAVTGAKIADDQINSEHYVDGSIDTQHIADAQVTTAKIADSNVTTGKLAADAVTAAKLADNAVVTANIVDANVTTGKIAADAVTNAKIADNSIDSEHYVDGSIDTEHINDGSISLAKMGFSSVGTSELVVGSVNTGRLADNSVTLAKMTDSSVGTSELVNDAVTTDKIANNAITMAKLANGTLPTDITVASANLVDGTVATADIADNAITSDKIAAGAVDSSDIGNGVIDTVHIGSSQITTPKIADSNITTAKITDANVTTAKIANDAITIGKLGCEQTTLSDSDLHIPTSGAVVDYVAAQLAPLGGFEAIANEQSFPNTQPASGVVISIADAGGLSVSNSGTASGQTVGGTTVNITGIASNFNGTTVGAGIRFLVASTGSGQNYTYHKATLKEDDLINLSGDINDFGERYRIGSSNPTSSLDNGDLFFNTSTGKMLVYNGTNTAWEEVQSIGNFFISTLSPAFDGTTQNFTITNAPSNVQQVLLVINGVVQKPNSGTSTPSEGFALDGSTIKLGAAPATGSTYHAVVLGSTVNIGTPSNNTVSTAILQDDSVTQAKIAAGAVGATELGANAVTTSKLEDGGISTVKIADEAVTLAKLPHGTSSNNGKFLRANNGADPSFETVDLTTKFTKAGGDTITGDFTIASGTTNKNINVDVSDKIRFDDDLKATFGNSDDFSIYHDGTNSIQFFDSQVGAVRFRTDIGNSARANLILGTGVDLYHNNALKFGTDSAGVYARGDLMLNFADNYKIKIGAGNDLQIYHNGSNSYLANSTGQLVLEGDDLMFMNSGRTESLARFQANGAVELYNNNERKLSTAAGGLEFFGRSVDCQVNWNNSSNGQRYGGVYGYLESGVPIMSFLKSNGSYSFVVNDNGVVRTYGTVRPNADNSYDLGTTSHRWANVYTNDLHLSNEGHSNDVDGTWGNWTIQEGESDLFLKNNRSGKKYKFNLTEVS